MRRTVNIAFMPSPLREITTPPKTCTRAFSPSRMVMWTSTWSPMVKSATFSLRPPASTRPINRFFMFASVFCSLGNILLFRHVPASAACLRLPAPPFGNRLVVAAQQDFGNLHPAENARPCILRILDQTGHAVRFLVHALLVAQHSRHIADHRVDHHHRRHFAAVADEVANRDFPRREAEANALVETLVSATEQDQPLVTRQLADNFLSQPPA